MPLSVSYHQIVIHFSPQLQGPSLSIVRLRHSTRLSQLIRNWNSFSSTWWLKFIVIPLLASDNCISSTFHQPPTKSQILLQRVVNWLTVTHSISSSVQPRRPMHVFVSCTTSSSPFAQPHFTVVSSCRCNYMQLTWMPNWTCHPSPISTRLAMQQQRSHPPSLVCTFPLPSPYRVVVVDSELRTNNNSSPALN